MSNSNLYLVGTSHYDLGGKRHLDDLLRRLKPDIIGLEWCEGRERSLRKAIDMENMLKKIDAFIDKYQLPLNLTQRDTLYEVIRRQQSAIGFEIESPKAYKRENPDCSLEYIDMPISVIGVDVFEKGYSHIMLREFLDLFRSYRDTQLFLKILDGGPDKMMDAIKEMVQWIYTNWEEFVESVDIDDFLSMAELTEPTEVFQTLKFIHNPERKCVMATRLKELYNGRDRIVAPIGLQHLKLVRQQIEVLDPTVMTLLEYSSL